MFGGNRHIFERETIKPKRTGETLARLVTYFKPWWPVLLLTAIFVVVSTWAQVTTPELTGELVDCYLSPVAANVFGGGASNFPGAESFSSSSAANCWLASDKQPSGFTQTVIRNLFTLGSFQPASSNPTESERLAGLGRLILLMIGLYVMSSILTGMTFFSMTWAGQHVLRALREAVFEHLHRLPIGYYAEHEAGDLMSRITNDTDTIQQVLNFALVNVASGILLLVWIAYNMLTQNVPFALLSMVVTPIMVVATVWFSGQARKAFRRTRTEIGNVNAELQESISAVREVQAFNRAEENIEQFRQTNAANRDANVRAVTFTSALSPTLQALGYLALSVVTVAGGIALLNGNSLMGTAVSLGLVITFLAYVQRFNQPIQQISVLWTNIQSAVAGAERIFGLLDIRPAIEDSPEAQVMPEITGEVEFVNVSAAYIEDQPVLCDINFTVEPGQTIAIVGPTGAGKTTIINLIPRFYDVTGGAVLIDGTDVRYVTQESLRKQIGIVLQDTFLFSTTVLENIRFGRPDATDEECIAAAQLAHADSFIERLPEGYQTLLGERGSGLSQGQRQLLAIARAALADPRILILDEATSSVDTRTERLIQRALEKLLTGRTSFVVAHRLSTIRNADLLLVVDGGEIVEQGKHSELLAKKGFYYDLYMSQFRSEEQAAEIMGGDGHAAAQLAAGLPKITYQVQRGEVTHQEQFVGQAIPVTSQALNFRASGRLGEVLIKEGDLVKKGQVLAALDQLPDLKRRQAVQILDLRRAQIQLEIARLQLEKYKRQPHLVGSDGQDYDLLIREQQVNQAQIDVEKAQIHCQECDQRLADAQLVAPFDGQVLSLHFLPDRNVAAYQSVLLLGDTRQLEIGAHLEAGLYQNLQEGLVLTAQPIDHPGKALPGVIRQVPSLPDGDVNGGELLAIRITLQTDLAQDGFAPGDRFLVTVVIARKRDALWLPPEAIRNLAGRNFVVVQEEGRQRRVDVKLGLQAPDRVEILNGFKEGQLVVSS